MRDRQQLEELTGAVSLGVLAEEMVLATGRLLRDEQLGDKDLGILGVGQQLLERLSSESLGVVPPSGPRRMDTEEAYLDAFRAARLQAPGEPAQEFLGKLADVLGRAIKGETLSAVDRQLLPKIQEFFAQIGELTLARTNDLFDRSRKERFRWIRMTASSPS